MLKVILISIAIAALGFIPLMGMPGVFVLMLSKPFIYLMYGPLAYESFEQSLGSSAWGLCILLAIVWPITIPIAYWLAQKIFGPVPFFSVKHLVPFCSFVLLGCMIISSTVVTMNYSLKRLSDTELFKQALIHGRVGIVKEHWDVKNADSFAFGNPLYIALENKQSNVADYLLDNGADPHKYDHKNDYYESGMTPLHTATMKGLIDIMEKLLQIGVDPNIRTANGSTPLHDVGQLDKKNNQVIEVLKKHKADFTAVDNEGNTVLMTMVKINAPLEHRPLHAQKLIEYGCPKDAKNNNGQTALDIVEEQQPYEFDLIEILK